MKKILLTLFVFSGLFATAQTYNIPDNKGVVHTTKVFNSTDSISIKANSDSVKAMKDSAVSLDSLTTVFDPTAKINVSDTATMFSKFARQLLVSNVQSSSPSDITEDTLYAANIPANSIGINGSFYIMPLFTCTNNANNKVFRIYLNGTKLTDVGYTTINAVRWCYIISNRNSTSSQISGGNGSQSSLGAFGTVTGQAISTYSINTATSLRFAITVQKDVATDAASLECVQVLGYY